MLQDTVYHSVLRVASVVFAFVLLFESGMVIQSTSLISQNTHQYLANAVGVGASVEPNELNMLTAELTAQKRALDAREAALAEREIAVELSAGGTAAERSTYVTAGILFIILVLIVLNYVLDYLRVRESQVQQRTAQTV